MFQGMPALWKDPTESPRRLLELRTTLEYHLDEEREKAYADLVMEELKEGVIVPIPWDQVKFASPMFVIKKPKKLKDAIQEWRKIHDLRTVNAEMIDIHFRMQGPDTVQELAQPGDWATSLDISSAFHHVRVSDELRPFLCFRFRDRYFAYQGLPFGAKHSPRMFTLALGFGLKYVRANWKVRVISYMDDILLLHQNKDTLELATLQIALYLRCLRWTLSPKKCEFIPAPVIKFLGWQWCFRTMTLRMDRGARDVRLRLVKWCLKLVETNGSISCKKLGGVIGCLNFLRAQIPRASLYLKRLHCRQ
jgi:hypothetical protein